MNYELNRMQNKTLWCLQNGWIFITSSDIRGAWVATDKTQFYISGNIFWSLVHRGLIRQAMQYPFDYMLTDFGKQHKTIPVKIKMKT